MNNYYPYMNPQQPGQMFQGPQMQQPQQIDISSLERRIERLESVIFDAYAKSRTSNSNVL